MHDVHLRSVVADHIEIGGDETLHRMPKITRHGQGFQKNFGEDHRRAEVDENPAFQTGDDGAKNSEIHERRASYGRSVRAGMLVHDVRAQGHVHGGREFQASRVV